MLEESQSSVGTGMLDIRNGIDCLTGRGNQLVKWASEKKWKIRTWEGYSFRTRQYKSNIDFFITKGLDIGNIRSPNDVWTGHNAA